MTSAASLFLALAPIAIKLVLASEPDVSTYDKVLRNNQTLNINSFITVENKNITKSAFNSLINQISVSMKVRRIPVWEILLRDQQTGVGRGVGQGHPDLSAGVHAVQGRTGGRVVGLAAFRV